MLNETSVVLFISAFSIGYSTVRLLAKIRENSEYIGRNADATGLHVMIYDLLHSFVIVLFLGLLALAAINDVAEFKIPNRISLAIAALYPVHVLSSPVPVDWVGGLSVGGIALVSGIVLFALRIMGGGDIKLITVTALWAGPSAIMDFIVSGALAGGVMSLIMLSPLRYNLAMVFDKSGDKESRDAVLGSVLPYGVAIAIGGFVVGVHLLGSGRII